MKILETYYEVKYKLRGTDKIESFREDNIKQAYSFLGSIKYLCTHTDIQKIVVYKPSFELVT